MAELGLIVEGHCEYDSFPSILSKIPNTPYFTPIVNAGGIGNILKNLQDSLLSLIKTYAPRKIVITLDYRDALRENIVSNCVELKDIVSQSAQDFIINQVNGSLQLPNSIVVVIADKTFETWICADILSLKENVFFNDELLIEDYENVDVQIDNPTQWLESKLIEDIDIKSRRNRVKIYKGINPENARLRSKSFDKFYREVVDTRNG